MKNLKEFSNNVWYIVFQSDLIQNYVFIFEMAYNTFSYNDNLHTFSKLITCLLKDNLNFNDLEQFLTQLSDSDCYRLIYIAINFIIKNSNYCFDYSIYYYLKQVIYNIFMIKNYFSYTFVRIFIYYMLNLNQVSFCVL